eukprot:10536431-Lingulodinium_polyedra.AAC.1
MGLGMTVARRGRGSVSAVESCPVAILGGLHALAQICLVHRPFPENGPRACVVGCICTAACRCAAAQHMPSCVASADCARWRARFATIWAASARASLPARPRMATARASTMRA